MAGKRLPQSFGRLGLWHRRWIKSSWESPERWRSGRDGRARVAPAPSSNPASTPTKTSCALRTCARPSVTYTSVSMRRDFFTTRISLHPVRW